MNKLLLLVILSFAISASAQEVKYDCEANKSQIINDLSKDITCFHDEECGYFNYGYPWQPDICMKAIINTKKENHNITNLRIIEEYNRNCVYNNPAEKKKYNAFQKKLDTEICNNVPRTYCYKGFCRIQSYAIYNDK